MCFTGGFALAMMVDDSVVAPVVAQPSVPFPSAGGARPTSISPPDDLAMVRRARGRLCGSSVFGTGGPHGRRAVPRR